MRNDALDNNCMNMENRGPKLLRTYNLFSCILEMNNQNISSSMLMSLRYADMERIRWKLLQADQ